MNVTTFGTGYVGLVSSACLADMGNRVLCFDIDEARIRHLNAGRIPIHEPGLAELVERNMRAWRLAFTTSAAEAVGFGSLQLVAVGTPGLEDGTVDLRQVMSVVQTLAEHMLDDKLVVLKSTVPVGTARQVAHRLDGLLASRGASCRARVVSNPEFLKEGAAIEDFRHPDRVIVGCDDAQGLPPMRELYAPFLRRPDQLMCMDTRSAELAKYAANAMLATRISFMNELARLAEALGADIDQVRQAIGSDPRIGASFLHAGCGYGGSCLPKDVRALVQMAASLPGGARLLQAVDAVNETQKRVLPDKIRQRFGDDLSGRHFALWGLAFKPGTDDMRCAPSCAIIDSLLASGATVAAYDPVAGAEARRTIGERAGLSYGSGAFEVLEGADALIVATEWQEFRSPSFDAIARRLRQRLIFDGRNLYSPHTMRQRGFEYHSIGRS